MPLKLKGEIKMKKIVGFRSGKTWKKVIATFGYLFIATFVYGMVSSSKPEAKPSAQPYVVDMNKKADSAVPVATTPASVKVQDPVQTPTFVNVISVLDSNDVKATIKRDAEAEWNTNYNMVKFEINMQTEAYNYLKNINIKSSNQEKILDNAYEEWVFNFNMVKFEYELQMKAYNELNK